MPCKQSRVETHTLTHKTTTKGLALSNSETTLEIYANPHQDVTGGLSRSFLSRHLVDLTTNENPGVISN